MKQHPELRKDETFLFNTEVQEVRNIHIKDHLRLGEVAYDEDGKVIEGMRPIFVDPQGLWEVHNECYHVETFKEIAKAFTDKGYPEPVRKERNKYNQRREYELPIHGMQFHIDVVSMTEKEDFGLGSDPEEYVEKIERLVPMYLEEVKEVYDYLVGKGVENLWVMSGGGMQVQAFFGDDNGYIAIAYFGLEGEEKTKGKCDLSPQSRKNDNYFEDFKSKRFRTRFCRDMYPELD